MLTKAQKDAYERDGFLVLRDFCAPEECAALRQRATELVAAFDPNEVVSIFSTRAQTRSSDDYFLASGDQIRFFFEENAFAENGLPRQSKELSINKIGHALHDYDPVFARFSRSPALAELAADLGYRQPALAQSMYIFKQPRIGGEVTCHQDATFLYTEPLTVTGFWFALEDATRENGCLWVLPGGHKLGLKARFLRATGGGTTFETYDAAPWPDGNLLPLEVPAGALVVLHGLLPHLSHANLSPRSRHAYTLHLLETDALYPADNWLRRAPNKPWRGFATEDDQGFLPTTS